MACWVDFGQMLYQLQREPSTYTKEPDTPNDLVDTHCLAYCCTAWPAYRSTPVQILYGP